MIAYENIDFPFLMNLKKNIQSPSITLLGGRSRFLENITVSSIKHEKKKITSINFDSTDSKVQMSGTNMICNVNSHVQWL